jgi:hypothetical protein
VVNIFSVTVLKLNSYHISIAIPEGLLCPAGYGFAFAVGSGLISSDEYRSFTFTRICDSDPSLVPVTYDIFHFRDSDAFCIEVMVEKLKDVPPNSADVPYRSCIGFSVNLNCLSKEIMIYRWPIIRVSRPHQGFLPELVRDCLPLASACKLSQVVQGAAPLVAAGRWVFAIGKTTTSCDQSSKAFVSCIMCTHSTVDYKVVECSQGLHNICNAY